MLIIAGIEITRRESLETTKKRLISSLFLVVQRTGMGRDFEDEYKTARVPSFNPRIPCGCDRGFVVFTRFPYCFNPHTHMECDCCREVRCAGYVVSIRASV